MRRERMRIRVGGRAGRQRHHGVRPAQPKAHAGLEGQASEAAPVRPHERVAQLRHQPGPHVRGQAGEVAGERPMEVAG